MIDVICFGSLNMDLVSRLDHLPQVGETIAADQLEWLPGGKGANQAVAASRLGAKVAMVGRVGSDTFGRQIRAVLEAESIDTSALATDPAADTGLAMVLVDPSGRNMIVTGLLANGRFSVADVDRARTLVQGARVACLQMEMPSQVGEEIIRRAAAANCRVIFNQAPPNPIDRAVLALVDVLVVNEVEAQVLSGLPVTDRRSAVTAAQRLKAAGPKAVVVTLGADGAVYVEDSQSQHLPAPSVQAVDTTAAGDTFVGALAVAIASGKELAAAVHWAQLAAALATTRIGAIPAIPTQAEVKAFEEHFGLS